MSNLSRRSLVTSAAALPALAVPAAAAASSAADARIKELWTERTQLATEGNALDRAYGDATAQLPEWAASGPMYLQSDGAYSGPKVGWPRMETTTLPKGAAIQNVRPSPYDIRKAFETDITIWGRRHRKAAQKVYEKRMAAFNDRRRRQQEEKDKVGLPTILARMEAISKRIAEIEDSIASAPPSPTKAATMFIVAMCRGHSDDTLEDGEQLDIIARSLLPLIHPHLSGLIAQQIADLIEQPGTPHGERSIWPG